MKQNCNVDNNNISDYETMEHIRCNKVKDIKSFKIHYCNGDKLFILIRIIHQSKHFIDTYF